MCDDALVISMATSRATTHLANQWTLLKQGNTNRDETPSHLIYMSKMYFRCVIDFTVLCCDVFHSWSLVG
jgi:hypothetical protein